LGQNFSRAQDITFQDQNGQEVYAWTTSWGVSTRLVGALIMTHGDDDGLVLPPKLAPKHVVVLPIYRSDDERAQVLPYCESLANELNDQQFSGGPIRAWIDDRDMRGGEKNWQHIKRGVPLRAEIGPRDIAKNSVFLACRDTGTRNGVDRNEFVITAGSLLDEMQQRLFQRALELRETNTREIDSLEEFKEYFTPKNLENPEIHGGFASCHWSEDPAVDEVLKELKVTIRCVPLNAEEEAGRCIVTGKPSTCRAVFGKAY
jgi:prolyl-tRNA synthetase